MRKLLAAVLFAALSVGFHATHDAQPIRAGTPCPIPYPSFVPRTLIQSAQVNANNAALQTCIANATSVVDWRNISQFGIYASQIIPTTVAQGTFGGTQPYTFPTNVTVPVLYSGGTSYSVGGIVSPPGGSISFCADATCRGAIVNPDGSISAPNLRSTGAVTAANGIYAYNGSSTAAIALAGPFSQTVPTITNSSDAGMNFGIGAGSGLGYRFFKQSASALTPLGDLSMGGIWEGYGGDFGGGSFIATANRLAIGNDTANGFLRNATGSIYFQNGDGSQTYAVVGPSGTSITGALNVSGVYNSFGTSAGNGVLQVPGTGIMFLNLTSGSEVQVGNGAGAGSGIHFYNNGTVQANNFSAPGVGSTFYNLTLTSPGQGNTPALSVPNGDIYTGRNNNTGYVFFGNAFQHYFGFDGSNYQAPNGGLNLGGNLQSLTVGTGALNATTVTTSSGGIAINAVNGDIMTSRGANSGVVFLGANGQHYVFFDGTNYVFPGGNITGGVVTSLNGLQGNPSITSPDNSVSVGVSGTSIAITSPPQVPATYQFGGAGLVTVGASGEVCHTVPYSVIGATANYGANTNNLAVYIIEVDQQTSNFGLGSVCFRALNASGTPIAGVGLYYNITTTHTLHG